MLPAGREFAGMVMTALPPLSVADEEVYPPPVTFTEPVGVPEVPETLTVTWSASVVGTLVLPGATVTVGVVGLLPPPPPPPFPPPPPQPAARTAIPESRHNTAERAKVLIPGLPAREAPGSQGGESRLARVSGAKVESELYYTLLVSISAEICSALLQASVTVVSRRPSTPATTSR
jgi:hypothetical protein